MWARMGAYVLACGIGCRRASTQYVYEFILTDCDKSVYLYNWQRLPQHLLCTAEVSERLAEYPRQRGHDDTHGQEGLLAYLTGAHQDTISFAKSGAGMTPDSYHNKLEHLSGSPDVARETHLEWTNQSVTTDSPHYCQYFTVRHFHCSTCSTQAIVTDADKAFDTAANADVSI